MYRIFIAEDESASMNFIKNIIAAKCPEFTVVGEASDGAEALEKLQAQSVDVLISDIQMSNVNGIELVQTVKQLYPHVLSVIISGYSDFEYAQSAIRANVSDYIMKPIDVAQFINCMNTIAEKLSQQYLKAQINVWHNLISKNALDKEKIAYYIPKEYFTLALIRRGWIAQKSAKMIVQEVVYTEAGGERWVLSGRDSNELLVIFGGELPPLDELEKLASSFSEGLYFTIAYAAQLIKIDSIYDKVNLLAENMDEQVTIGITQMIKLGEKSKKSMDSKKFLNSAAFHMQNENMAGLKNELVKHFGEWETSKCSALQLERVLNQFFIKVSSYSGDNFFDYAKPLSDVLL